MEQQLIKLLSGLDKQPVKPETPEEPYRSDIFTDVYIQWQIYLDRYTHDKLLWNGATQQAERILEIVKPVIREAYLQALTDTNMDDIIEINGCEDEAEKYLKSLDL